VKLFPESKLRKLTSILILKARWFNGTISTQKWQSSFLIFFELQQLSLFSFFAGRMVFGNNHKKLLGLSHVVLVRLLEA
jgi:hypothetical protein